LFSTVIASINDILLAYYTASQATTRQWAVCSHCLGHGSPSAGKIEITKLQAAFVAGRAYVECPIDAGARVPLVRIAPDVCLAQLPNYSHKQLKLLNVELGSGGFGTVTLGELNGQRVAVKQLNAESRASTRQEATQLVGIPKSPQPFIYNLANFVL